MRVHVLRLQPGDDLRAAMEAQVFPAACILSAVGSFTRAVLRFAERDEGTHIQGPLELLTLAGTLGPGAVHLHASVSNANGAVLGGHVMAGCVVRTTAEIVVAELAGWEFTREHDPETGFKELAARQKP